MFLPKLHQRFAGDDVHGLFISQIEIFDKGGLLLFNKFSDFPHHRGQVPYDLIIPESDHPQPQLTQHLLLPFIFLFLQIVDIPIHLHNQPRPVTVKIDDESLNDLLSPKVDSQLILA